MEQLEKSSAKDSTDAWLTAINIMDSKPEQYGSVVLVVRLGEQIKACLSNMTKDNSNFLHL